MKCFYHPTESAVAKCEDCQKYLCHSCAIKYSIPICDACNKKRINKEKFAYIKTFVISLILFVVGYNLKDVQTPRFLSAYFAMSVYSGWKCLDIIVEKCRPRYSLWLSSSGLLFYYGFKLLLSIHIGVIVTPFYLFCCGRKLLKLYGK